MASGDYIIPSDNWEQQRKEHGRSRKNIISYQAITGNNNKGCTPCVTVCIISYQAITGNNNPCV